MSYTQIVYLHLGTVVPGFFLGTALMLRRKGSATHKGLGKVYMALMFATGLITLCMPAFVGPRLLDHLGFIHLLSLLTLFSVPAAILAARRRDIAAHRSHMIGLYVGGLLIAGSFAFMPGRMLHSWLFG